MAAFLRANFARGVLAAGIDDVASSLTLQSEHNLPTSAGSFRLTIYNPIFEFPPDDTNLEVVTATYSGTPNVYTIVRAQESTSAHIHQENDVVSMFYTAGVSQDDLTWLGSYQVDETGVAANKILNISGGKLKYTDAPTMKDLTLTNPIAIYALSHDSFAGYAADKHVDHTTISVTGTDGCGGGGTIASNRTITNTDKGSTAVVVHLLAFDHTKLHDAVTLSGLSALTLTGQEISLTAGYVIPTTTQETNWTTAYSASHAAITIPASPNGLSLTGQEISLPTTAEPTFAALTVDANTLYVDKTNHRVGVGTATPETQVHVYNTGEAGMSFESNGSTVFHRLQSFRNAATGPLLQFRFARGSKASPAVVRNGILWLTCMHPGIARLLLILSIVPRSV